MLWHFMYPQAAGGHEEHVCAEKGNKRRVKTEDFILLFQNKPRLENSRR